MKLHREMISFAFLKGKGKTWDVWMFYQGEKLRNMGQAGHYSQAERMARSLNKINYQEIEQGNLMYETETSYV